MDRQEGDGMKEQPYLSVEEVPTDELIPYARNAKIHTNEQIDQICSSIEEFGFADPVGVWEGPNGLEIVEGHGRVMAAKKLGMAKVPIIRLDYMTDKERKAYGLAHNKLTMNTGWDFAKLDAELDELAGEFDMGDFGFDSMSVEEVPGLSDDYSQNVGTVEYEPRDTEWKASELYEFDAARKEHLDGLISEVKNAQIKKMLKIRLDWFCEFDFAKIADYYANQATAEEQRAFEGLGLVLLDRDQLIANGFADIAENLVGGVVSDSMLIRPVYTRRGAEAAEHRVHHQQGQAEMHDGQDA